MTSQTCVFFNVFRGGWIVSGAHSGVLHWLPTIFNSIYINIPITVPLALVYLNEFKPLFLFLVVFFIYNWRCFHGWPVYNMSRHALLFYADSFWCLKPLRFILACSSTPRHPDTMQCFVVDRRCTLGQKVWVVRGVHKEENCVQKT